jgi:hypothetical protein
MAVSAFTTNHTDTHVSVNELKRLLITITDYRLDIGMRYRFMGEMWEPNYMRILRVTEYGLLLNDEIRNRLIVIRDLSQIIQFELDTSFHAFQPYLHYTLIPNPD